MSARLIDDVLIMILEELALPAHAREAYRSRQETLRSVCLASRRLRRLAQPMLWRQSVVRSREQLDSLVSAAPGALGRYTKLLTVVGSPSLGLDEAIAVSASFCPEVAEIRLACSPILLALDFALLSDFTNLRKLHVEKVKLLEGQYATLPALEELCLHRVVTSSRWVELQLRGARVPRLREVYFIELPGGGPSMIKLDEAISPDILHGLEILQVDARAVHADGELARGTSPPVLIFHPQFDLAPRPLDRHTFCHPFLFRYNSSAGDSLSALAQRLDLTPPSPPSTTRPPLLVLPLFLRRVAVTEPLVKQHMRVVEALCVAKGVRIMWDDEELDGELISPAFRRCARELREARALER
ncbi:hypothetical protein JCM8208_002044 [Rhodotorula glutinis]